MSDAFQSGAFQGDAFQIGAPGSGGGGGGVQIPYYFESLNTDGTYIWDDAALKWGAITSTVTLSTLNETQGTYSWKVDGSPFTLIGAGQTDSPTTLDLSGINSLSVDVYVESIASGGSVGIFVYNNDSSDSVQDLTPVDGTGAYTLTVDLTTLSGSRTDALLQIGLAGAAVFYIDNLREPASGYTLATDSGSYAFTGTNAALELGREVLAGGGSFAFTGTNPNLEYGREVTAGAGSYAFTGTNASLERGYEVIVGAGSYTFTGVDASLEYGRRIVADAGSYGFTGTDANLEYGRELAAAAGSYAYTGVDANLEYGRLVTAGAGSYAFTGVDVSLEYGREITADSGSYAFTGTDAALIKSGADKTIAADPGSYAFTGTAANLEYGREVTADAGAYAFTGTDVALDKSLALVAEAGAYTFTGTDAVLDYTPANQNQPQPSRYGGGYHMWPEVSWLKKKKKKTNKEELVREVAQVIEQAAPQVSDADSEVIARRIIAQTTYRQLQQIATLEAFLARVEAEIAEMDDEEVLLLAA